MIYRFKIWFEDMDDVIRIIDMQPAHSFLDFHTIIQESIGFDKKEAASFYISDHKWRKLEEISLDGSKADPDILSDKPTLIMKDNKLRDWINDPHQQFIYVYDYTTFWTLFCELQTITDEAPKKEYPLVFRSEGKAPRQREDSKFKMLDDNEFDTLAAKIMAAKGVKNIMEGAEEEIVDADDDTNDEDEKDEFGFSDLEGGTDEEFGLDGFTEVT